MGQDGNAGHRLQDHMGLGMKAPSVHFPSFTPSNIHEGLLCAGIMLGPGDTMVNQTDKNPCPLGVPITKGTACWLCGF